MERLRFREFFLQAWAAAAPRKLPWIFGAVIAAAGIAENQLSEQMLGNRASFKDLIQAASETMPETMSIILILILLFAISIFGKSNLIVSLAFITGKTGLPNHPNTAHTIAKNFFRAFRLECLAFLAILAVIGILAIPLLIASSRNPEALTLLIPLSIFTLILVAIIVFLIKQLALFYLLLSPVRTREAIELGSALLYRFVIPNLLFGLFSLALAILFTFCVNLVILGIAVLFDKASVPVPETYASLAIGFASFAWFAVFQQALWLAFFKSIASPREPEKVVEKEEAALITTNLPEIPPAQ
ncbi:MAG: hypothetical protein AAB547_02390 [Patescibacteria group bacterium]